MQAKKISKEAKWQKRRRKKKNFFSHYFAPQCLSFKLSEKSDFLWWRGEQQVLWFYVPASPPERWLQNLDHLPWPLCTRTQPCVWRGGGWASGRWTHGLKLISGMSSSWPGRRGWSWSSPWSYNCYLVKHLPIGPMNIMSSGCRGFFPRLFPCSRVWKWRWHVHYY